MTEKLSEIRNAIIEYFGDLDITLSLCTELSRFFCAKIGENEIETFNLSPSPDVDQAWHEMLLRPVKYYNFCQKVCGQIIDHSGVMDKTIEHPQYNRTVEILKEKYGLKDSKHWPEKGLSYKRVPIGRFVESGFYKGGNTSFFGANNACGVGTTGLFGSAGPENSSGESTKTIDHKPGTGLFSKQSEQNVNSTNSVFGPYQPLKQEAGPKEQDKRMLC